MSRLLIIGSGFAGMWSALAAARLRDRFRRAREGLRIDVVAPSPFLHIRPRLYEDDPSAMQVPLLPIFEAVEIGFIRGKVESIDTAMDKVDLISAEGIRSSIQYDRVIVASGSRLFRAPVPGLSEYAFSVDQITEAAELKAHIAGLDRLPDTPDRNTVVVAGGGFTGIETAAEMPARLRRSLGPSAAVRVFVIEQADAIGPDLGPGPRPVIEQAFAELGVECRFGVSVTAIGPTEVTLSTGERIPSRTVIWTAGLRASPLTGDIPGHRDHLGRLHVAADLRVIGADRVFATGDVARAATDDEGHFTMMSCQHAMNMGRSAGHNAAADLLDEPTRIYRQVKYVTCLDLGPWGAVYTEGWDRDIKLRGRQAKDLKRRINGEWIYPPRVDREEILASADPDRIVVA